MDEVVLNCCVTETNETPCRSEGPDDAGKVQQGAREAVDLVDHDGVDARGLDVRQEPSESGPINRAAGEPAVVVAVGQAGPALLLLAGDVGLGRLTLGVEAVELLVQTLVRGLAGVDGAADKFRRLRSRLRALACLLGLHRAPPLPVNPKNSSPFQCDPVIAFATVVSDR
jgi:hypothetical protein